MRQKSSQFPTLAPNLVMLPNQLNQLHAPNARPDNLEHAS